jgi:hypothetical protein
MRARMEDRGWRIEDWFSILHPSSSILYPLSSLQSSPGFSKAIRLEHFTAVAAD